MSKFDIVIYIESCITDKLITGLHPTFKNSVKYGVGSIPSINDIRFHIVNKNVAFLGGGFYKLYSEICEINENVSFILRDEDEQPDLNMYSCQVEKWYNYWCQLSSSNSPMMKAIYKYTYQIASLEERIFYESLVAHGVLKMNPSQLINFFKNLPSDPELQKLGKDRMNFMKHVIDSRLDSAKVEQIETSEGKVRIVKSFGDCYQTETCSSLLENNLEAQVACLFHYNYYKGVIVGFFLSRGQYSSKEVANYYFETSIGSKFISQGSKSFNLGDL